MIETYSYLNGENYIYIYIYIIYIYIYIYYTTRELRTILMSGLF